MQNFRKPPLAEQRFGDVRLLGAHPVDPAALMRITDEPPTAELVADALVTPFRLERPVGELLRGSPARRYDAADRLVPVHAKALVDPRHLLLVVLADPAEAPAAQRATAARLPGRHLYAGDLKPHFGHFLLESLGRAWAFADRPAGAKLFSMGRSRPRPRSGRSCGSCCARSG